MLEVPADWQVSPLAAIVAPDKPIVYGIVQAGPECPTGVPYIKSADVRGKIDPKSLSRTSQTIANKYKRSVVVPGDIVFSLRGNIGELSIVPPELDEANLTQGTARISVNTNTSNRFIAQILRETSTQRRISRLGKGSTFQEISLEELRKVQIALPPLSEQRYIADILGTWDSAIEKLEALRAAKEKRFDAVINEFFGPTRVVGGGKRTNGWNLSTFGEVFVERKDRNDGLTDDDVVTVGKYRIGKQSDHFTRSVASKDLSPYWTISPGDFVYDPMSAYYGALGRYTAESNGLVSPAYRVIQLREDLVDPGFMVQLLRIGHIRFLLEARSSQGNKEGKRRSLQRSAFDSIEFFLPPLKEQRRLAAIATDFEKDVELTTREIVALKHQKRGLMQKLLTGEWRVCMSNDEDKV